MIVIDASMTAAVVMPDEPDPPKTVLARIYAASLIAPAHWPAEIDNALLMAMRRKRITSEERLRLFERVHLLDVDVAANAPVTMWTSTLTLADDHKLTFYDAAYLQLAIARGAALASNDDDLTKAARLHDIEVFTSLP